MRRKRIRHLPRSEWRLLIPEHHQRSRVSDWQTFEANQARIAQNTRPDRTRWGRRERRKRAAAGPASCGHCGRRLRKQYRNPTPRRVTIALLIVSEGGAVPAA